MSRILSNVFFRRFASRLAYQEYGPPSEVIFLEEFEDPKLDKNSDNVIIKMLASPVHPADINTIQGTYPIKPPLPAIGGGEGVGQVIEAGNDVKDLKVGDWVFPGGNMKGTWTSHYQDSEKNLVKVRKDLDILSAATLRTNPGTAYRMLKDFVDLKEGDIVIQNGANSAVGKLQIKSNDRICSFRFRDLKSDRTEKLYDWQLKILLSFLTNNTKSDSRKVEIS